MTVDPTFTIAVGDGFSPLGVPCFRIISDVPVEGQWLGGTLGISETRVTVLISERKDDGQNLQKLDFGRWKGVDQKSQDVVLNAAVGRQWIMLIGISGTNGHDVDAGFGIDARIAVPFSPGLITSGKEMSGTCRFLLLEHLRNLGIDHRTLSQHCRPLLAHDLAHDRDAAIARSQSEAAIIWVGDDWKALVIRHRGPYLFYAMPIDGPECRDIGMNPIPTEPGWYLFTDAKPWGYWSDGDYDEGIDGRLENLTDAHLRKFGVTWPELESEIAEYKADIQGKAQEPA